MGLLGIILIITLFEYNWNEFFIIVVFDLSRMHSIICPASEIICQGPPTKNRFQSIDRFDETLKHVAKPCRRSNDTLV